MELTSYADRLRADLAGTVTADPEARAVAERLLVALDPAVRLVLLEALSEAAAEITASLDGDVVDVRLRGRDPELVVTPADRPSVEPPAEEPAEASAARITLRLPDAVKTRAEERAARAGQSLNAWLVEAVRDALGGRATSGTTSTKHVRGWVG